MVAGIAQTGINGQFILQRVRSDFGRDHRSLPRVWGELCLTSEV